MHDTTYTYVIGDLHGCYDPLCRLLDHIHYDPEQDHLWFTGDLINRGPDPLKTLRFVKSLQNTTCVLGNHDLMLLAIAAGHLNIPHDCQAILDAPDRDDLLAWLQKRPVLHYNKPHSAVLVHAGILPSWSLNTALALATELSDTLQNTAKANQFFPKLYGNQPDTWDPNLQGADRMRFLCNVFTRMRFVSSSGQLNLNGKESSQNPPVGCIPWYDRIHRSFDALTVYFGHWASLNGQTGQTHCVNVDTGCVWGGKLTAHRLEDNQRFDVSNQR